MNVIKQYSLNPARVSLRMTTRSHTLADIEELSAIAEDDWLACIYPLNEENISIVVYQDRTWGIEFPTPETDIPNGYELVKGLPSCIA